MAETFDATSRLAQGRPAADTVQEYVWACHLLGYQDPDLTLHASQVRDWYGSEDGIELAALDADCEALRAVAAASEAALARQDGQLALMAVAWQGPGAQTSRDFLRRHGEASTAAVYAVRIAAESLASLRDRLWQSVDGKVAATLAAEGRGARPDWQAAAHTVVTGAGDRATASELVDQEVKPFVANDIRSEWLTEMRSAMAAIADAYDAALAEVTSEHAVAFEVPGDFGPIWVDSGGGVATAPAGTTPVAALATPAMTAGAPAPLAAPASAQPFSAAPPLVPASAPPSVDPAAMAPPSMPSPPPSMPSMGGGMPDIGSGLSGFGGQLGDVLGGLLGTSEDALSDLPEPDEVDEPDELDSLEDEEDEEDEEEEEEEGLEEPKEPEEADAEGDPEADIAGAPVEEVPAEPLPAEVESAPTPVAAPPPIEPLDAPAPPSGAGTPCEIAANELPQVGE